MGEREGEINRGRRLPPLFVLLFFFGGFFFWEKKKRASYGLTIGHSNLVLLSMLLRYVLSS